VQYWLDRQLFVKNVNKKYVEGQERKTQCRFGEQITNLELEIMFPLGMLAEVYLLLRY